VIFAVSGIIAQIGWVGLWYLTPLSNITIFQLYRAVLLVEESGVPEEND